MLPQNETGKTTEQEVLTRLKALGLEAEKPRHDVGVDLEVWHPSNPKRRMCIQIKGRGKQKTNSRNRWFQIRTTPKQRALTIEAGLPVSEAWRKKAALCQFFVLVSELHGECWVFPTEKVAEIVEANRRYHGNRPDNVRGEQAEMDLDVERDGKALTEIYAAYKNNFGPVLEALVSESKPVGLWHNDDAHVLAKRVKGVVGAWEMGAICPREFLLQLEAAVTEAKADRERRIAEADARSAPK